MKESKTCILTGSGDFDYLNHRQKETGREKKWKNIGSRRVVCGAEKSGLQSRRSPKRVIGFINRGFISKSRGSVLPLARLVTLEVTTINGKIELQEQRVLELEACIA